MLHFQYGLEFRQPIDAFITRESDKYAEEKESWGKLPDRSSLIKTFIICLRGIFVSEYIVKPEYVTHGAVNNDLWVQQMANVKTEIVKCLGTF